MATNKVVINGETKIDLTADTVTAADVAQGKTFHDASGAIVIGTATGGGGALSILVTALSGSTVTASKDGNTYTGVEDAENPGEYTVNVPEYGTYTVTATRGDKSASNSVMVSEESVELVYGPLPDGYTQLEYIESTGTQYIDTGLSFPSGFRFTGTVYFTKSVGNSAFNIIGSSDSSLPGVYGGSTNFSYHSVAGPGFLISVGSGYQYSGEKIDINRSYVVDISNIYTDRYIRVDGVNKTLTTGRTGTNGYSSLSAFLFANNKDGEVTSAGYMRLIGDVAIYNAENILAANYIPAKRDNDSVIGMYDTVRKQFFTNAGTGVFTAGPEVE